LGEDEMNVTISKIKKSDPKKDYDWSEVKKDLVLQWYSFVVRRISVYWTWVFARTPITPNQLTIAGALLALVGCALFATGNYVYGIAGAILIHIFAILDHCDGTLARIKGMSSAVGNFLDEITSHVVTPLIFVAIGYGTNQLLLGSIAAVFISLLNITPLVRDTPFHKRWGKK